MSGRSGPCTEPSVWVPGCATCTVPSEPAAVWEPAPPICAVPVESSAVCGPPVAGAVLAENDAFGSTLVPSCAGDALAPPLTLGTTACTVPVDAVAVWVSPAGVVAEAVAPVPPEVGSTWMSSGGGVICTVPVDPSPS